MAYDEFSYDIEKAWCNRDMQKIITAARQSDRSAVRVAASFFSNFETLARQYLDREKQSCNDLDKQ